MARKNDTPLHLNPTFWKALGSLASTDETRATLTCVHVKGPRVFEVTDGHAALQVTLDFDTPLAPGLYDPKATAARVKAGVEPVPCPQDKFDRARFPDFDPILRAPVVGYAERCDVGLNPELVSRVNDAAAGVIFAVTGAKGTGLMWSVGEDVEAVILTGKAPDVRIHAAIMPMRVDGPRKRPKDDRTDSESLKKDLEYVKNERDRFAADAGRLTSNLAVAVQAREAEQKRADAVGAELSRMADYRAHLESVVNDLRADIMRLTAELNEAREAADTDAADAVRARTESAELRAELNALRHLRPKGVEPEPVLLTRPVARA